MKTISISPGWKAAAEAISHILAPLSSKDGEMVRKRMSILHSELPGKPGDPARKPSGNSNCL